MFVDARPIPGRGALGFFEAPDEVLRQARQEYKEVMGDAKK